MSVCDNCRFKTTYGDFCKKGIYMYSNLLCPEHDEDMKIHGNHADHVFVDTITFDKTNPFYVTTIIPSVKNVIFHPPATVILWGDGAKTVVKCREGETYDPEVGLAMCLCKKMLGTDYRRWFKNRLKKGGWE